MGHFEENILLSLTDSELRTVIALRTLCSPQGLVETTTEYLGELTGYSPATLRRAFRGLEERQLLTTVRTKRNLGKFSVNKYTLSPSLISERWQTKPSLMGERSTVSKGSYISNNNHIANLDINNISRGKIRKSGKELIVSGNKRWQIRGEDTSGDDEIGGFGLFENEQPATVKMKLSTDARDPKTRGRRPQENWTPSDVAAEFAYLVSRKYPYLPGLVQTKDLRGALAQNRKKYGITAVIEMEIIRMFLADSRMHTDAEKNPQYLHRRLLKMFNTHMDEALKNLGMPSRKQLANGVFDNEERTEYIYASDGREFDNSIVGRKALTRYEERLQADHNV